MRLRTNNIDETTPMEHGLRVLQLGKFYPIIGGVEKVAYDLMSGLSSRGVHCDMMCASAAGGSRVVRLNDFAKITCCHTWFKAAATMISPAMIFALRMVRGHYDIIHVHHPDPMACLALFLSGYDGRVILHWHSDILKQKFRGCQETLAGQEDSLHPWPSGRLQGLPLPRRGCPLPW